MGVYRSTPLKEKETQLGQSKNGKIKFCAAGMQGWRVTMEDAHISSTDIGDDIHCFGVFDGHGGREVAKYVQKHFVEELLKNANFKKGDYGKALEENFLRMDEIMRTEAGKKELMEHQKEGANEEGDKADFDSMAGCTANVVLITKNKLVIANAGDSRSCLWDNGKVTELSSDHKPDLEGEKDRVIKAGGFVSDGRINGNLNLSRALGDFEYKKNESLGPKNQLVIAWPDIKVVDLSPNSEFILMGCDGIWESLSNDELLTEAKKLLDTNKDGNGQPDLKKCVEALLDKLVAPDTSTGIGCDNMTSILITLK